MDHRFLMPNVSVTIDCQKIWYNLCQIRLWLQNLGINPVFVTKLLQSHPDILGYLDQQSVSLGMPRLHLGESRPGRIEDWAWDRFEWHQIRLMTCDAMAPILPASCITTHSSLNTVLFLDQMGQKTGRQHPFMVAWDTGDRREGALTREVEDILHAAAGFNHARLRGVTVNHGCFSGRFPSLGQLRQDMNQMLRWRQKFNHPDLIFSLGGSAAISTLLHTRKAFPGLEIRIGEAWILGMDPKSRQYIPGLLSESIVIEATILEYKYKPHLPRGLDCSTNAFGEPCPIPPRGKGWRALLGLGRQDCDIRGLRSPEGTRILGGSSDYLVVWDETGEHQNQKSMKLRGDYLALMGLMASRDTVIQLQNS